MSHRQLKSVTLTLLALGKIGEKYNLKPIPRLVALEKEIAEEEDNASQSEQGKSSKSLQVDKGERRNSYTGDSIDSEVRPIYGDCLLKSTELPG